MGRQPNRRDRFSDAPALERAAQTFETPFQPWPKGVKAFAGARRLFDAGIRSRPPLAFELAELELLASAANLHVEATSLLARARTTRGLSAELSLRRAGLATQAQSVSMLRKLGVTVTASEIAVHRSLNHSREILRPGTLVGQRAGVEPDAVSPTGRRINLIA